MADDFKRNRFIPFRKTDIVTMCIEDSSWSGGQSDQFREFYRILDAMIEKWFEARWNCRIDFEIDDALKKLERLKLLSYDGTGWQCLPLAEAKQQLDHIWDNYFTLN